MKKKSSVVAVFTPEAVLKRKVRAHLRRLGFDKSSDGSLCPPSTSKDTVRALHSDQRKVGLKAHRALIQDAFPQLKKYLAEGQDIDPEKIAPELELIEAGTWQSELFRLASLSWSVPVSNGFGRRLRYLVWDRGNNKLMGIIAIGDPVFNLKARDDLFAWDATDRGKRLVNILDAYVLGAIPPYNMILGGKLVSCLVRSREVRDDFKDRYGDTRGIISGKKKKAQLVVITTSSSLGRSSVYNRLKIGGQSYFRSIGFTQGWGHRVGATFTCLTLSLSSSATTFENESINTLTDTALGKVPIGAYGQSARHLMHSASKPTCLSTASAVKCLCVSWLATQAVFCAAKPLGRIIKACNPSKKSERWHGSAGLFHALLGDPSSRSGPMTTSKY